MPSWFLNILTSDFLNKKVSGMYCDVLWVPLHCVTVGTCGLYYTGLMVPVCIYMHANIVYFMCHSPAVPPLTVDNILSAAQGSLGKLMFPGVVDYLVGMENTELIQKHASSEEGAVLESAHTLLQLNTWDLMKPLKVWEMERWLSPEEKPNRDVKHGGEKATVEWWLNIDPQPSWRKLITALDAAGESSAANALRWYAEPLRGNVM